MVRNLDAAQKVTNSGRQFRRGSRPVKLLRGAHDLSVEAGATISDALEELLATIEANPLRRPSTLHE